MHRVIGPRILLPLIGVLAAAPATAQVDDVLAEPGDVMADTVHGRIDDWFALRTVDGEEVPYGAFQGRVLFVNFWATWCAPCIEEMPTIVELARSFERSDVAFLLVSIDDDERNARRFAEELDLSRFVYFRGWEPWTSTFRAGIVPATFVVDRDGSIVYQHHGAADWNAERIRHFLREKASG
jgi:thiol-disulfide isomerase/thioredoxin